MATTGCVPAGPSMKQLHPLVGRSASCCMSLPRPCKLGSLVFFYLPTRLTPATSITVRQRLPFSPPLCGHGELEIVSIKELADGFLHFSFGASPNTSKMDELSSTNGEHIAGKLSVPRRLPSKFSKKSPIPAAAARQRKRQQESSPVEGSTEAIPSGVEKTVKSSSRPKSSFVKRSPIPAKSGWFVGIGSESVGIGSESNGVSGNEMPQEMKVASIKSRPSMRPRSAFVRKSPIPTNVGEHNGRPPLSPSNSDSLPNNVGDSALAAQEPSSVSKASRPKSVFSRRSPIVKVHDLSPKIGNTRRGSSLSHKDLSEEDGAAAASSNSRDAADESSHTIPVDLEKCKLAELRNLAKSKGVRGYSKLKKGELLVLLKNLDD